jgi:hypothetical protein
MEEMDKAVVLLICAALLLAQESMKCPKVDLQSVPFDGVCRVFELGTNRRMKVAKKAAEAELEN